MRKYAEIFFKRYKGLLKEEDVELALKEIRLALLEAIDIITIYLKREVNNVKSESL